VTLTLDRVIRHTVLHRWSTSIYIPNVIKIGKTLWTDVLTDRHFRPPVFNLPRQKGFPWDDLRKIFRGCQLVAKVPNGVETLPKILTGWVGCTSVTDRRDDRQTTDGQATAYSEHEREFTFVKNVMATLVETLLWSPYGIGRPYIFSCCGLFFLLWSPYVIGRPYIFSSCFFFFFLSFFFFSSPNLSGRRLDVYHTLAHGVALVRI